MAPLLPRRQPWGPLAGRFSWKTGLVPIVRSPNLNLREDGRNRSWEPAPRGSPTGSFSITLSDIVHHLLPWKNHPVCSLSAVLPLPGQRAPVFSTLRLFPPARESSAKPSKALGLGPGVSAPCSSHGGHFSTSPLHTHQGPQTSAFFKRSVSFAAWVVLPCSTCWQPLSKAGWKSAGAWCFSAAGGRWTPAAGEYFLSRRAPCCRPHAGLASCARPCDHHLHSRLQRAHHGRRCRRLLLAIQGPAVCAAHLSRRPFIPRPCPPLQTMEGADVSR